jgi:hypothetical protein
MQIGAREVESGADLASRSGAAPDEIASAVGSSTAAVNRIVKAMDVTQSASASLVTASDAIAAIAQEANAAPLLCGRRFGRGRGWLRQPVEFAGGRGGSRSRRAA